MPVGWVAFLPVFSLAFARCAGALCLSPPLAWRHFPLALRLAAAAVLAVPVALSLPPTVPLSPQDFYPLLVRELAVGGLLALGLWLLLAAARSAGCLATAAPDTDDGEEGPLGLLLTLCVILLFIQLNGLPWLVSTVRESYELVPLHLGGGLSGHWSECAYWPSRLFLNLLLIGGPLVLATGLASLLVASLQRALPGLQLAETGAALRHLVALLVLAAVVPLLGGLVLGEMSQLAGAATALLTGGR